MPDFEPPGQGPVTSVTTSEFSAQAPAQPRPSGRTAGQSHPSGENHTLRNLATLGLVGVVAATGVEVVADPLKLRGNGNQEPTNPAIAIESPTGMPSLQTDTIQTPGATFKITSPPVTPASTGTPKVTTAPPSESAEPSPSDISIESPKPLDALMQRINAYLAKDKDGNYIKDIPDSKRFMGPNTGGTAIVPYHLNLPPDVAITNPDKLISYGGTAILGDFMGAVEISLTSDTTETTVMGAFIIEDTDKNRGLMWGNMGPNDSDHYFTVSTLNKKGYSNGERTKSYNIYTNKEFLDPDSNGKSVADSLVGEVLMIGVQWEPMIINSDYPEKTIKLINSVNPDIASQADFAREFILWDQEIADWGTFERQEIPKNLKDTVNYSTPKEPTRVDVNNALRIFGAVTG